MLRNIPPYFGDLLYCLAVAETLQFKLIALTTSSESPPL